jgi:hypothetical protein
VAERLTAEGCADAAKIERAFRDAALSMGNDALCAYLSSLPDAAPVCHACGAPMASLGRRGKRIVTTLGEGEVTRTYYVCAQCGAHAAPKGDALGIAGTRFTAGTARAVSRLAASDSFEGSSETLHELCGVYVSAKDVERIAEGVGEKVAAKRSEMVAAAFSGTAEPACCEPVPIMYVEYDGTGVPMIKAETEGRPGRQEDGSAVTREMKVGCVFTQHGLDKVGNPVRDKNSTSCFAAIEAAEDFGKRVYAEAARRGAGRAGTIAILGDGARWIWNIADTHFPGAIQIVDIFHAKEHLHSAVKATVTGDAGREGLEERLCALLDLGDVGTLTRELQSLPAKDGDARALIDRESRYFTENARRMDYGEFRKMGLFVGSGIVEATCKHAIGRRLKQSGMHWSVRGANSIAALRCSIISGEFNGDCDNGVLHRKRLAAA